MLYITLNHDIRLQTAYNLTDFMLNYLVTNDLPKSVTIGDCLGDPAENWYRKTPTGPDPALDAVSSITPDNSAPGTSTSDGSASTTPKSDSSKLQIGTSLQAALSVSFVMLVLLL